MMALRIYKQHEAITLKEQQVERFSVWGGTAWLPSGNVIAAFWFDELTIAPFKNDLLYRFQFHGGKYGHLTWDWIPLSKFSDSRELEVFTLDVRWTQWMLEFLATAPVKDFKPTLYLMERIL